MKSLSVLFEIIDTEFLKLKIHDNEIAATNLSIIHPIEENNQKKMKRFNIALHLKYIVVE